MNAQWEKHEGRDEDGDKFILHPLVEKETGRILATVAAPPNPDGYAYRAYFDSFIPDSVLNQADQQFYFISLDQAKAYINKVLTKSEAYMAGIKSAQASLA